MTRKEHKEQAIKRLTEFFNAVQKHCKEFEGIEDATITRLMKENEIKYFYETKVAGGFLRSEFLKKSGNRWIWLGHHTTPILTEKATVCQEKISASLKACGTKLESEPAVKREEKSVVKPVVEKQPEPESIKEAKSPIVEKKSSAQAFIPLDSKCFILYNDKIYQGIVYGVRRDLNIINRILYSVKISVLDAYYTIINDIPASRIHGSLEILLSKLKTTTNYYTEAAQHFVSPEDFILKKPKDERV